MVTITLQTPLLGPVDTTPALLIPAFRGHAYDDATVAAFATALVKWAGVFGIRASILAGQIAKETGYFRFGGQVQPSQFNLAGLGATNGGAAGASYPDIDTGVCAVCVHWMAYLYGDVAKWPAGVRQYQHLDDRYAAVLSTGHAGKVAALADVTNGVWAYTKTIPVGSLANGYASGIASLANQFVGASPVSNVPWDRVHISADLGPTRTLDSIRWFIVHDTEGHFDGDEVVLTSAGPPVESANLLVGRAAGQCVLIAPLTTTAWAAGNDGVGEQAVQVELSKGTDERGYTDYQYAKLAEIYAYCVGQGMVNVPPVYLGLHPADANGGSEPDDAGVIGHAGVPNPAGLAASPPWGGFGGHTDPGPDFDWPRFIGLLGNAPQPPAPPFAVLHLNGHVIGGGFKAFWEANPLNMQAYGLPTSEEIPARIVEPDGRAHVNTVQFFERAIFVYDPAAAPGWTVTAATLGQLVSEVR